MFDFGPFPSGLPAGSIVHEFDVTIHRLWFTGDNAHLFDYGDNRVTTTRPIPLRHNSNQVGFAEGVVE